MVGVPLALNLFVLAGLGYLLQQEGREKQREEKEHAINQRIDDVRRLLFAASNAAFKYTLRRDAVLFSKYNKLKKEIEDNNDQLLRLESDDRAQTLSLEHIHLLESRILKVYDAAVSAVHEGRDGFDVFRELQLSYEFQALTNKFVSEVERFMLFSESQHQSAGSRRDWLLSLKAFLCASFLANIALSIFLARFFGRNFAGRLATMIDNTLRLAGGQPLHPIVRGNDEISLLDAVYHEMANVLKEAHRKERVLVDNAVDIICTIDEKRKFADVSPASELVWGYSPTDLIGRSVAAVISNDELSTTFPNVENHKGETVEMNFENRIKHKDGRLIDMLWSTYWSADERTYFCVAHDITVSKAAENRLKESEARILAIIENLPVGLLIHNQAGTIELTNRKAEEMLLLAGNDLLEHNVSSYFAPGKRQTMEAPLISPPSKSFAGFEELSCLRGDGGTLPIELYMNDLYYQGQRKSLAIIVDVSERHQLENARKELVNMVSHDLRTPLNAVVLMMDLLLIGALGQLTQAETDMAVESQHELNRLLALINGLLDLERIQAGALELEREVTSSLLIVDKAIDAIVALAKKSKVILTNYARDCELFCDANRLIEVIVLFVMDAMRQTASPTSISIFADETDAATATQFRVVSRREPAKLSTNNITSALTEAPIQPGASGTGLWLVICKGIVAAHKGTLEMSDNDGDETVYAFKIPLPEFAQDP